MFDRLRKRLALGLLKASERIAPAAAHAAAPLDPLQDFEEDAGLEELPTLEPIAISERVLTRSMRSLKVEAFIALGALHAAHVVGEVIWDGRRVQSLANHQLGHKSATPSTLQEIGRLAKQWANDQLLLANALGQLNTIEVGSQPLMEVLAPDSVEAEVVDQALAKCEAIEHVNSHFLENL